MQTKDEHLKSINEFYVEASSAVESESFLEQLGGLTIFAGIIDFLCIQAARSMEQTILKDDLQNHRNPRVQGGVPHEDEWFYDQHISTRRIIKQIEEFLPHITGHPELKQDIADMCENGNNFLNYRITAIHYVGNPRISREKMESAVEKAIVFFRAFDKSFRLFREKIHPLTFSEAEKKHFYGTDSSKGLIIGGK